MIRIAKALAVTLLTSVVLATVSVSPALASDSLQDAQYSAKAITRLNAVASAIAAAGGCGLPASTLTNVISALAASPQTALAQPGLTPTKVCANVNAVANPNLTGSALTSMWAWGNSVSVAEDDRGLGEPQFLPQTISTYAASRSLKNVRLSVPWAADQGAAISGWVGSTVAALHASGQTVSALGGETDWVSNPSLVRQWITAAHSAAPFNGIQLDVEPWTSVPNWTSNPAAIASYVAMVRQAETTAHSLGLTLGIDAPWWLSTTPYLSGTVLTAVLADVDTVSIVAFSDHANGTDGIIAQAWPAVEEASATLTPFTVGVQTSSDAVAGGAQYTFADKGSAVLESETAKVRAAYTTSVGYSGVTVEEYLSWLALGK